MTRREEHRIADILTAISDIRQALHGIEKERFLQDRLLRNAVSMSILVISEATRHLSTSLTDPHPEVPWRNIVDIGNIIRHVYFRVDYEALWVIQRDHLAVLETAIRSMADEIGREAAP